MELAGPVSGLFFAGNDYEWEFTVTIDGEEIDITNMIYRFVMARTPGSDAALTTEGASPTATAAASDAAAGKFKVTVDAAVTTALHGTYQFQAQVEDLSGDLSNVLHGYFTFRPNLIPVAA